jgi:Bacterial lectin/PQQ-like domain/Abnormal spindle-like microcephaly-assoc'd, ASPM-SPD-2-Hydin
MPGAMSAAQEADAARGRRRTTRMGARAMVAALALIMLWLLPAGALGSEPTNAGDNLRDGWYPEQSTLTPQLVSGGTFGQLWSASVEGSVYAQPLLADGEVLVATENNKVYALDPTTGAQKWSTTLAGTAWKSGEISCGDLAPNVGVTATPVVDPTTNTAYMTHKAYVSGSSGTVAYYMDAIDLATGAEREGFPVQIAGTAQNASGQTFEARTQLGRPGLLLMNGVVYAAFGSDCDTQPWQGWVFGVSTTGQVKARWVAVPSFSGAGIWESGAGITSDGPGTLLVSTGNGGSPSVPTPGKTPPASLGESIIRLNVQPDGSLKAADFFAPFDAQQLDEGDVDFASGGITALNSEYFGTALVPHLAVAVGKDGYVYLLNRDELGGYKQGSGGGDKVVERLGPYGGVWSRPGVWPGNGGWIYIPTASAGSGAGESSGHLLVYQYGVSGAGQPTISLQATSPDAFGFGTGAPVITSEGTTSGSALVWVEWMAGASGTGAQLRAYDPVPVEGKPVLRWSAAIGTGSKFATPGIGAGKLFVGNREGKVFGFGSPVTPVLSGPSTAFPTTTIGSHNEKTVTLTANAALTVEKISSTSPRFTPGTSSPALPAALAVGQTIKVPVTFTPTEGVLQAATLNVQTSKGTLSFSLQGNGQTSAANLEASPTVLSFGGTAIGSPVSAAATFRNTGGAPLTIEGVKLPAAPFGASEAPAKGTKIEPGGSLTIEATFEPQSEGNFEGELALETSAGTATVTLTGSAGKPGVLKVEPLTNEYGAVPVGSSATRSFTVANTGGTNVTITKSKPPTGGVYAATTSLSEGTTIKPGETLTESVTFAPGALGYVAAVWPINGDDTTGLHEVHFTGTGTVPAPGTGWSHNGTATISAGTIQTTAASTNAAGSAFFEKPLESRHLLIEFDQTIGSGSGADGQTLTFADASKAAPTALGERGGGLGFAGISGIAVGFDTYKNAVNPSNNFVGISDGAGSAAGTLHWLATSTAIPALRTATRHVKVEALNGTLTVWVEGTQALSTSVTLPPEVYLGFTGGTGGLTDVHQAANVKITGEAAPKEEPKEKPKEEPKEEPKPASLKITNTVNAPAGSSQAASQMTFSGSCPSSFTTAALGNGGSATPTLTGAAAGASCSVSEAAPSGSGWKTTAAVNGGAPVELTASGGKLTVLSFVLAAGVNTVALTNTFTASGGESGSKIPDPSAGGWQLNGSSLLEGTSLVLTTATASQAGTAFWPTAIDPANLNYEFTISIGGGTGADGLAFVIADASKGATPTSLGESGGGLGFATIPGYAVAFDTFKNSANPSSNFAGISNGVGSSAGTLHWLGTVSPSQSLRSGTHKVKVSTDGAAIAVWLDGTKLGSLGVTLPSSAYIGFSGGTGTMTDIHAVSGFTVAAG